MQEEHPILVVQRDGSTTVVTGWRAWVLGISAVLAVAAVFVFLAFVFLGLALTIGAVLLIAVPVAIVLGLLGYVADRRR